jgi:hypothetical protein
VSEEPSSHDQEDLSKQEDVLAFVNMSMVNSLVSSSSELNGVPINANESQKVGEELPGVKPPPNRLSLYNFVRQVKKRSTE